MKRLILAGLALMALSSTAMAQNTVVKGEDKTVFKQKTTTSPFGRDMRREGAPIKISEMLALLDGVAYIERTTVNSVSAIKKTKKAIKKAFQVQMDDIGFSLVEVLSPCPTNWKMSPLDACKWIDEVMTEHFPLGVIVDRRPKTGKDKNDAG